MTQSEILLSIIVLSYKDSSFALKRVLDSIVSQALPSTEIILVDRNLNNDLYSLGLQEDASEYENVRVISCPNMTQGESRNSAFESANGKYVVFSNGCNAWDIQKNIQQVELLEESSDAAVCICPDKKSAERLSKMFPKAEQNSELAFFNMYENDNPSAYVYSKKILSKLGEFDKKLDVYCDTDMLLRINNKYEIIFLNQTALLTDSSKSVSADEKYKSYKYLFYKYYEKMVLSRELAFTCHMNMSKLSSNAKLWIEMVIHFVLAFFKKPFFMVSHYFVRAFKNTKYFIHEKTLQAKVNKEASNIKKNIKKYTNKKLNDIFESSASSVPLTDEKTVEAKKFAFQFSEDLNLNNICIESDYKIIRKGQFANCKNLVRVVISSNIQAIEPYAFFGCTNLREIEFEDDSTLNSIGAFSFANCESISRIILPSTLSHVGDYAFANCINLEEILFHNEDETKSSLVARFPVSIQSIPDGCFANCQKLRVTEFTGNNQNFVIGNYAFLGCKELKRIFVSDIVKSIGKYSCLDCVNLKEFIVPHIDSVELIKKGAFQNCQSLTHFQIPFALQHIPANCFYGCKALSSVRIPSNVKLVDNNAFAECVSMETVIMMGNNTKYLGSSFYSESIIKKRDS